jgi:hypothetical protein
MIYSIRDANNKRLSTLQVVVDSNARGGSYKFRIVQNKALRNAEPSGSAQQAASAFIKALNDGRLEHRVGEALEKYRFTQVHEI